MGEILCGPSYKFCMKITSISVTINVVMLQNVELYGGKI
jgi:hypothetical protein